MELKFSEVIGSWNTGELESYWEWYQCEPPNSSGV